MFAIVDIQGSQYKVEKDQEIFVNRMSEEEGKKVKFDSVLLLTGKSGIKIGKPYVKGAKVEAKVVEHLKGDKVIVFKKKRRKGFQTKNGHRQALTRLQIDSIK